MKTTFNKTKHFLSVITINLNTTLVHESLERFVIALCQQNKRGTEPLIKIWKRNIQYNSLTRNYNLGAKFNFITFLKFWHIYFGI